MVFVFDFFFRLSFELGPRRVLYLRRDDSSCEDTMEAHTQTHLLFINSQYWTCTTLLVSAKKICMFLSIVQTIYVLVKNKTDFLK